MWYADTSWQYLGQDWVSRSLADVQCKMNKIPDFAWPVCVYVCIPIKHSQKVKVIWRSRSLNIKVKWREIDLVQIVHAFVICMLQIVCFQLKSILVRSHLNYLSFNAWQRPHKRMEPFVRVLHEWNTIGNLVQFCALIWEKKPHVVNVAHKFSKMQLLITIFRSFFSKFFGCLWLKLNQDSSW